MVQNFKSTTAHTSAPFNRKVTELRSFLLIKAKPGLELEIQNRLKALPEVREIHLITGKFDFLVTLESEEIELDPRQKVIELVLQEIRKSGGVVDTRTIIPINSQYNSIMPTTHPTIKAFVFIQTEAGKENELTKKLLNLPEITGVHLLFGKADILTELNAEKSLVHPPPQHIANLVQTKIGKLPGIHDTDTYVPLESIMKNQ
jgi:DNA-binding Lrp family transcriptional regulator